MALCLGPDNPSFRIYITDIEFNSDPPVPVMDPPPRWSMGSLNFKRLGLQGNIKENVSKLWKQREKQVQEGAVNSPKATINVMGRIRVIVKGVKKERMRSGSDFESGSDSPMVTKRRGYMEEQTVKPRNSNPSPGFHNFVRRKLQSQVSR